MGVRPRGLTNPYADTRILVGDRRGTGRAGCWWGSTSRSARSFWRTRLGPRGAQIDLLLAHHPEGRAVARLEEVMGVQADIWRTFGVPISLVTR